MKIIIEIECTLAGGWQEKYEGELIELVRLPGVIILGGEDGCDVILDAVTWTFQPTQQELE